MKPGEIIGEWRVLRTLGKGGMGMVFLGQHVDDEHEIAAVKLFHAWADDDDGFRRFERECEVLQRLDHPGIVPLKHGRIGTGRDVSSGIYWMAMAYIDGPSLEARLDHGPLPPGYAAATFHQLADALEHAHSRGVFHRDLKPANIVLGIDGVRLVDFGIALQEEKTRLTAVGTFAGTLPYMPPEVVLDDRSRPDPVLGDIYALGVVLYEALTGERAFQTERGLTERERQMRILKAKMSGDVLDPGPGVPEPLRKLVQAATDPSPGARLSTWSTFKSMLTAVAFGPDVMTTEWQDDAPFDEPTADVPAASTADVPGHGQVSDDEPLRDPTPRPRGPRGFGLSRGAAPSWSSEDAQDSDFHPGLVGTNPAPVPLSEEAIDEEDDEPTELTAPAAAPPVVATPVRPAKAPPPPPPPSPKVVVNAPPRKRVAEPAPPPANRSAPGSPPAPPATPSPERPATNVEPPRRGGAAWIAAALLLIGLAIGGGYLAGPAAPPASPPPAGAGVAAAPAGAGGSPSTTAASAPQGGTTAGAVAGGAPSAADLGNVWSDTGEPTWTGHPWPTGAAPAASPTTFVNEVSTPSGKPQQRVAEEQASKTKAPKTKPDAKAPDAVKELKVFFRTVGEAQSGVTLNGSYIGETPFPRYLTPGTYTVEFTPSNGASEKKVIEIATYGANEILYDPRRHEIRNVHK